MNDLFNMNGAKFSDCGKYRYVLWRNWDNSKPKVMFIGLNPSTANETYNDPTIRRVIGFAKSWGFGGMAMLNLFAIVSPDPKVLATSQDPVGDNDGYLETFGTVADTIVFAWGSFREAKDRAVVVSKMFPNAICLKKSAAGNPWHPLYVPANVEPIYYSNDQPWRTQ